MDKDRTGLFESCPVPRAVAKLAIPTVMGTLVMILYNIADTWFVGMLGDPVESAAVSLAAPALLAFNAVNNLFGVGGSSMISRCLGRKDEENAKRCAAFSFYLALFSAALISVMCLLFRGGLLRLLGADEITKEATSDYLFWTVILGAIPAILNVVLSNLVRSEGLAMHASIGVMSGCILNVILDPIFIMPWGFGMNAAGAGCATFISNSCACLYFFVLLAVRRGKTYVSLDPRKFGFYKEIIVGVFTVGIPASIQNLLNVTGMTVLNNFTAGYGTAAVAAMGITHKVNLVPIYFTMGLGQGMIPLVGYNYASGNTKRMRESVTYTLKITVIFITVATLLFYIFSGGIIGLFMKNAEIVAHGTRLLRGFCLGLPFLAVDFFAVAVFQSVGMGRESLIFAILRKIVLEIPAIILLNKLWPLYGIAYSQLAAEFVLCIAAVFVLKRLFSRLGDGEVPEKK